MGRGKQVKWVVDGIVLNDYIVTWLLPQTQIFRLHHLHVALVVA